MHETAADIDALQAVLDRSYATAGAHLLSIHTPQRRLSAAALCERLTGMRLLVLSTVARDGRPVAGPVDGILFRGSWYFGSATDSLRFRHIRERPRVSAVHVPGEELAVTVHGRAVPIDVHAASARAFRDTLLSIYVPRYGPEWEGFIESAVVYARIDAERLYAFAQDA